MKSQRESSQKEDHVKTQRESSQREDRVKTQREGAICKPREEALEESNPADTLRLSEHQYERILEL